MQVRVRGWSSQPLTDPAQTDDFWRLCRNPHVCRYLLDGEAVTRDWAARAVAVSQRLFAEGGAGLWLMTQGTDDQPSGFAGFWNFEELGPQAQLLYAMLESKSGRGHATQFAEALVDWARRSNTFNDIVAAVDGPNAASIRVLQKIGFAEDGQLPGAFGTTHLFRLSAGRPPLTMSTERLRLRPWRTDDLPAFAALNADPQVMKYFPSTLSAPQSNELAAKIRRFMDENGWGLWAVEVPGEAPFIGFVGLAVPTFDAPFMPATEIGWRLARPYWGRGYATEAARRVLDAAFTHLGLSEVISMTAVSNAPSRGVMEKIGLVHDPARDFEHPKLPPGHSLRAHVLYAKPSTVTGRDSECKD